MKKYLVITLAIASLASALLVGDFSFAQNDKTPIPSKNTESSAEDPDIKLSIEQLKKKYPISWMKKKYGDSHHPSCGNSDGAFEYDGPIPSNLTCSFVSLISERDHKSGKTVERYESMFTLDSFSVAEIKSVLVNIPQINEQEIKLAKSKGTLVQKDERLWEIAGIAFSYFENTSYNQLTPEYKNLKSFALSDKIVFNFERSWFCSSVKKGYSLKSIQCISPIKK